MRRLFKAVPYSKYKRLMDSYSSSLLKVKALEDENETLKEKNKNLQAKNKSLNTQLKKSKKD